MSTFFPFQESATEEIIDAKKFENILNKEKTNKIGPYEGRIESTRRLLISEQLVNQ